LKYSFPTPAVSALELGPLTVHFYALCIITGIAVAIWVGDKRFKAKAVNGVSVVAEVAITAVPVGIIGGRIYHVLSSPAAYFGKNGQPIDAIKIWEGGLGIWGAISIGLLGAFFRYRTLQKKLELPSFTVFIDCLAPGILFAQAIGRFGNWFNGELFGRPLDAWWSLQIPVEYRPSGFAQFESFHPTFLYEAIWCSLIAVVLIYRGKALKPGQTFAAYVFAYCFGRLFIELIRIDTANTIAGLRVNVWVSLLVGLLSLVYFLRAAKERPKS
jgi:prolipoprotein diacylglyceryl transferase